MTVSKNSLFKGGSSAYSRARRLLRTGRNDIVEEQKETIMMTGTNRAQIKPGFRVSIVTKQDQRSGKLTQGVVKEILTNSPTHPHGIKVRLESGEVGRVKEIEA